MKYLLDTNVISETIKRNPNESVISWLNSINANYFCISVLTLGEIRKGAEKLQDISRKQKIVKWLQIDLARDFAERIIAIDEEVADKWGYITSQTNVPAIDGLIGASAIANNLILVTRNSKDFISIPGLELINPWEI